MSLVDMLGQYARPILTSNIFQANFNIPTPGQYDFADTPVAVIARGANQGQVIEQLFTGSVYLVDRISVGGNIFEGDYLESIATLPLLKLRLSQSGEIAYKKPLPMVNFIDDGDFKTWILTDKGDENLTADLTGVLNQTAAMVGVTFVRLNVSFTIYAVESTIFNIHFRDTLGIDIGSVLSGR